MIQVVLLMAGAGSRFLSEGFEMSKPLIQVGDVPMFVRALASLEGMERDPVVTYVVRHAQTVDEHIDEVIRGQDASARIVELAQMTSGAAESALSAMPALRLEEPVVVLDCDLWFSSQAYLRATNSVSAGEIDAAAVILGFAADDPRFSFVKSNADGVATEIAEKVVISDTAIAGAYFFRSVETFVDAARSVLNRGISSDIAEFYMSEVLKQLLVDGRRVVVTPVDEYVSYGTPEELRASAR